MDNELFELCKKVYEKTGWDATWWFDQSGVEITPYDSISKGRREECPVYDTDHLLGKLPTNLGGDEANWLDLYAAYDDATKTWFASYEYASSEPDGESYSQNADTPLKALLKLTLALHEAGELK